MPASGNLIIDDVEAALAAMTDLGRDVASTSVASIHKAVVDFALRRGWFVLRHKTYVEWACDEMRRDERAWIILDPLFPVLDLGERLHRVRLSRLFDNNETVTMRRYALSRGDSTAGVALPTGDVGLLDDAIASGFTLSHVSDLLRQTGASVARILVCASSGAGRNRTRASIRTARLGEFVRGDWRVIHLRDGCPHLPHTGRPVDHPAVLSVDGKPMDVRVPSSSVDGSLWHVMCTDDAVRTAIGSAQIQLTQRLSAALARLACVRDLSLLGPSVPVLVRRGETVTADATLESLLRTPK